MLSESNTNCHPQEDENIAGHLASGNSSYDRYCGILYINILPENAAAIIVPLEVYTTG